MKIIKKKVIICNKAFPSLGIEAEDYFPIDKFTPEAIEKMLQDNSIREEIEEHELLTEEEEEQREKELLKDLPF